MGLHALSRALSQKGVTKKIEVIAKARVLIIKFVEKRSGISFDVGKLLVEEHLPDHVGWLDDVAKVREKFDFAKQRFLYIPDALDRMPKMNPEGIYVNKNLRLDSIQVYGFDYDYTLAHYSSSIQVMIYG